MKVRDDFRIAVKRILGHRVGLLCSNPECRAATFGPQTDPSNAINVGVAAHITGAASGGPRFDSSKSAKEATNGAEKNRKACAFIEDP
jgi:hypothetical protein